MSNNQQLALFMQQTFGQELTAAMNTATEIAAKAAQAETIKILAEEHEAKVAYEKEKADNRLKVKLKRNERGRQKDKRKNARIEIAREILDPENQFDCPYVNERGVVCGQEGRCTIGELKHDLDFVLKFCTRHYNLLTKSTTRLLAYKSKLEWVTHLADLANENDSEEDGETTEQQKPKQTPHVESEDTEEIERQAIQQLQGLSTNNPDVVMTDATTDPKPS